MNSILVRNPATEEIFAEYKVFPICNLPDLISDLKIGANYWKELGFIERKRILYNCANELENAMPEISEMITKEMGRPLVESRGEVLKSASFIRYFADIAEQELESESIDIRGHSSPDKSVFVKYTPRGVAGLIKPWNAPIQQLIWGLAPALAAGCSVLMKPSEYAPGSALMLQQTLRAGGIPDNVYTTVLGGPELGQAIAESNVDIISFTGSLETGRKVAGKAALQPTKTVMELSGKDALIVGPEIDDIDLVASGIVFGAFSNCGQWCSSIERVFIHSSLYEKVLARVKILTEKLRVGDGLNGNIDIGPIANQAQYNIVTDVLEDAINLGARVHAKSTLDEICHKEGYFFPPTVLTNVSKDSRLRTENFFGPLVEVERFEDVIEVIEEINRSPYGLGTSVWTKSKEFASRIISAVDTGMVWVNEPMQSLAPCPWSVCKKSGYGAELGASGLKEFVYPKVVNQQYKNNTSVRPWYFPYE